MSDNLERLKKLRALALRGVDGEKEQAQAIFEKLMKKYDISFDDLDEDILHNYEFEYHGKEQESILCQTIYRVTNSKSAIWDIYHTYSGRKCKTRLIGRCTAAQKVEIDFLFDFYKTLWDKERKTLLLAFIQKHKIFGELKDDEKATELLPEEAEKMFMFMQGLSNETPRLQIEEKAEVSKNA